MIEPKIILKQKFAKEDILIKYSASTNRKIDPALETSINDFWNELYKKSKEEGKEVYNGELYRFENYSIENDKLNLTVNAIEFKTRMALVNQKDKLEILGERYYPKNIGLGALIKTIDNKYIFGKRSGKTLAKNPVDIIGGVLETKYKINNGEDLFKDFYRELKEELNILESEIEEIKFIGILQSSNGTTMLVLSCSIGLSSKEVLERFKKVGDEENSEIIIVDKKDTEKFLLDLGGYRSLIVDLVDNKF